MLKPVASASIILALVLFVPGCAIFPRLHPEPTFPVDRWEFSLATATAGSIGCPRGGYNHEDVLSFDNLSFQYAHQATCVGFEGSRRLHHETPVAYEIHVGGNFTLADLRDFDRHSGANWDEPSNLRLTFPAGTARLYLKGEKWDQSELPFSFSMDWVQVEP